MHIMIQLKELGEYMGYPAITLTLSDPAGVTILQTFKDVGFTETDMKGIFKMGNIHLVVVEPQIVPDERYVTPEESKPYPYDYDQLAQKLDISYYVIASRHWAASGKPCLTVHPTGNFGKAMYGGRNHELQRTLAIPMRNIYMELLVDPPKGLSVSLEATHHSPTEFLTPMFFAEIGSRITQWQDEALCRYLSDAILAGVKSQDVAPVAVGFGGGHYCPTFSVKERETAFGHIAAKYALDDLSDSLIAQMVERTLDGVDFAVFDKGLKGHHRKKIEVALKRLDVTVA